MPSLQQMFSLPLASPKWRVGEARTRRGPACSEGSQGLELLVLAAGVRTQRNPAARPTPNEMPGFSQKTQRRGSPGPRSPGRVGDKLPKLQRLPAERRPMVRQEVAPHPQLQEQIKRRTHVPSTLLKLPFLILF